MPFDPLGIAFAFMAGVFSLFSPCGFPMLPGYISYYMGTKPSLEKAATSGTACAAGLLAVFSLIGASASAAGSIAFQHIRFLELFAGLATTTLGLSVMFDIRIPFPLPVLKAPKRRSLLGVFLYGALYGLASFGCSAPIFFSVLLYAVVAGGLVYGTLAFVVYGAGMALPLIVTTILVAKAKNRMLDRIVNLAPLLQKVSGVVLIVVGAYLVCYYLTSQT